jgi:hypothetical protein
MPHRNKVKTKVKNESTSKAAPAASASSAPTPARPQKIKVLKLDANFRGARASWYERLKEYNGKTEGEYIESCKDKPPAVTKNGTAENPTGWVRFFARSGILSLTSN